MRLVGCAVLFALWGCEGGAITIEDGGLGGSGGSAGGGDQDGTPGGPGGSGGGGQGGAGVDAPWCAGGCAWATDEVASFGGGGLAFATARYKLDAVIDGEGRVVIATIDVAAGQLRAHIESPGGGFSSANISNVVAARQGAYVVASNVSLARADEGVYAAFADNRWRIAEPRISGWEVSNHGTPAAQFLYPEVHLAMDASGVFHFFNQRFYRSGSPQAWVDGPNLPVGTHVRSLGLGADGAPWVLHAVAGDGAPVVRVLQGDSWVNRTPSGTALSHAAFAEVPGGPPLMLVSRGAGTLQLLTWADGDWQVERVVQDASPYTRAIGLARDAAGYLHVAYRDDTGGVAYAWRDEGGWTSDYVASVEADELRMLLRADGEPVIVALDEMSPTPSQSTAHVIRPTR